MSAQDRDGDAPGVVPATITRRLGARRSGRRAAGEGRDTPDISAPAPRPPLPPRARTWSPPAMWQSLTRPGGPRALLTSERLPLILLGGLLLVGLVTVLSQAHNYGITLDEQPQERLGRHLLAWYGTFGRDTSFLTVFPAEEHAPQHGGIFDVFVSAAQYVLPPAYHWPIRAIITGLCGLAGVVAIALCGYELGGPWVAFVSALGLWLYPRYYGAIYNNPKDIPAAVALAFVLWATLLLAKQWEARDRPRRHLRNSLLLGACLGVAAAIRVNDLIWCAVLAALLCGWWLFNARRVWRERRLRAELAKQGLAAGVAGMTTWLTMMALWPYVFLNPVGNLIDAIQVMSHYPWNGTVLYEGTVYPATQIPASYAPEWLVIGSPPALILLAALGFGILCVVSLRTRRIDPLGATAALAFLVPFAALLALRPVLYDGLRHFLFLIPPLVLMAAYGLIRAVTYLAGRRRLMWRWAAAGLATLALVSYGLVAAEMVALSPFEYTYFSPVIGGLPGAYGKYDTDYWASCSKQSAEWLARNYRRYTGSSTPTISVIRSPYMFMVSEYLPPTFQQDDTHPAFFIARTMEPESASFPTYDVIHTVDAEGVPLCVIKADPSLKAGATR